ncbi:hypothetical protein PGT21_032159 [Puccinia graminis f. sp. tritici]|uniref:Vacuolar import and degradation protein 27 n=1 Tax=Puccinia graminis f. sp. tritici TaxID=56615 RepID=A0A5B0MF14_PUCGR|nr:hypothetical protein PGT21_032159 [Puccinia graminis f. sp. tritici]
MFNVVRRLFGATPAEGEPAPEKAIELISLPAGRLNLIRPKHVTKVEKECIYLEAGLIIRRTSIPFHYQLVVARLGEGDEELESEDALEDDYEKAFLLAKVLDFRVYETVDDSDEEERPAIAFSWLDLSSPDISERFEFVISSQHEGCSSSEIERVEDAIVQCIWEGENEKDSSEAPEDDLLVIKESFDLPCPQSEISHPAQPLPLFRPPSTIPSEDSDIEQTADTTLDYSETSQRSRVFRPPSLHSEDSDLEDSSETEPNPGANAEEQGVEDDSDSSADEIVNQLRGTTLADKRKEQPTSSPISRTILGTPSRTYSPKADPSSHRKPHTSFSTDQVSPAKEQSPSHSAQRAYHNPTARASSPTSTSASEESLVNEDYEINHRNPTSHNDESLRADEDPEVLQSQSAIDNEDHSLVEEQSFIAEQSFVGETVSAWKAICNLYIFKSATTSFERWETGARAELWVSAPQNPQSDICWLTVKPPGVDDDDLRCVISTPIGSEQNLSFSGGSILFHYRYDVPGDDAHYRTWALRFPDDETSRDQYTAAQEAFAKALYDRDHGLGSYEAQDRATKDWSRLTYGVSVEGAYDEEDEGQSDDSEEAEDDEEEEDYPSSDDDDDDDAQLQQFRSKKTISKNSCFATGANENLTCVSRDDMLGLFKNESTNDKKLKFMATIPELRTPDGRVIRPTKIMMYGQDSTVVVQDESIPEYLFPVDLAVGKIVDSWDMDENIVKDFFGQTKTSQMEQRSNLIGTSFNKIFRIDPRVDGPKAVAEMTKSYKTKMDFSCGVTTASGQMAIGAETGIVRLFDPKIGKIAKTALPGVRDAIRHLDVTNNGRYLVATCQKYLLLWDCQMSSGQLGFDKSFPKDEKPGGIRIELTKEHRAQIIDENIKYCFKDAKFNQGDGEVERKIITAIGPYIIEFDLKSILDKNKKTQYTLKRYQQNVVGDNFRWGNDKDIVVALESDVIMEKRSKLSKPNRKSIVGLEPINSNRNRPSSSRIRTSTLGAVPEWEE